MTDTFVKTNKLKQIAFKKHLVNAISFFTIEQRDGEFIYHPANKEAFLKMPDKWLEKLLACYVFYGEY